MISANESALRLMVANSMTQRARPGADASVPSRQNRRTPLIEAALEPARGELTPAGITMLTRALALVIGTEAMIVCKDVLQLSEAEAAKLRRWMIRALVDA